MAARNSGTTCGATEDRATFDTWGEVRLPWKNANGVTMPSHLWCDLDPFAHGYIEALPWPELTATCAACQGNGEVVADWGRYLHGEDGDTGDEAVATCPACDGQEVRTVGFSDLAPETLDVILKDCEAAQRKGQAPGGFGTDGKAGAVLWRMRQAGQLPGTFPPLAATLDDDGKVRLGPLNACENSREDPK